MNRYIDDAIALILVSVPVLTIWVVTDPPAFFMWLSLLGSS